MIFISWSKAPRDKLIFDAIVPGVDKTLTLDQAEKHIKDTIGEIESPSDRWELNSRLKKLKILLRQRKLTDLHKLTFGQVSSITDKLPKTTDVNDIRSGLAWVIRYCMTGEIKTNVQRAARSQPSLPVAGEITINAKFKPASIDILSDLLIKPGKHIEMVTKAIDAIDNCPLEELRVIDGTEVLSGNVKLRQAIRTSIISAISPKGWTCVWSAARKVLFVVRLDTLLKFKKGVKP